MDCDLTCFEQFECFSAFLVATVAKYINRKGQLENNMSDISVPSLKHILCLPSTFLGRLSHLFGFATNHEISTHSLFLS